MGIFTRKQKEYIRTHCPNIGFLRRLIAKLRLKELIKYDEIRCQVWEKAEIDAEGKKKIVVACLKKWPKAAKNIADNWGKDCAKFPLYKERKTDKILIDDILFSYFALGCSPKDYVNFAWEHKALSERKEYVTNHHIAILHAIFNDLCDAALFSNKIKTYAVFRKFFHREIIEISQAGDFNKFQSFVYRHREFVKKDPFGAFGKSVEKIDLSKDTRNTKQIFDTFLGEGKLILEELLVQNEAMAVWNADSVNTVRLVTILTKHGVVTPFSYLRVGRPGSFIDNASSGGITADIDTSCGVVVSDGYDRVGQHYVEHPDAHLAFKGFKIPDWEQLLELAKEASRIVSTVPIVGWDFCYTDNGWIMIEGNAMSQIEGVQVARCSGLRKELFTILKDVAPMLDSFDFEKI